MGDSPRSPGVTTRSRSRQSSQGQGLASPSSPTAATSAGAGASRSGSGSGSQPGTPRKHQQKAPVIPEADVDVDGPESDSDSAGSGRRPQGVQSSSSAKSPPSSGRSPKAEERVGLGLGAGEANGQPAPSPRKPVDIPAGPAPKAAQQPPADSWWMRLWNMYNNSPGLKFASFILFLALVVYLVYGPASAGPLAEPNSNRQAYFMKCNKLLFNKKFPAQSLDTQLNLLAQGEAMLAASEPRQPSAIAVLSPPTLPNTFAPCFVGKLGKIVNEAFDYNEPAKELTAQKMMAAPNITTLHTDLKTYLGHGGRAVIFHNIDKLAREEYLNVLHAYTDNFRAPSKRTTYYFILTVPQPMYEVRNRLGEWNYANSGAIAYELLDSAWKSVVSDDKRPAIIARVTPTVILLQEGDECW